jgi:hypothetical protein
MNLLAQRVKRMFITDDVNSIVKKKTGVTWLCPARRSCSWKADLHPMSKIIPISVVRRIVRDYDGIVRTTRNFAFPLIIRS